jgi:hypothetical protein
MLSPPLMAVKACDLTHSFANAEALLFFFLFATVNGGESKRPSSLLGLSFRFICYASTNFFLSFLCYVFIPAMTMYKGGGTVSAKGAGRVAGDWGSFLHR